MSFNLIAHLKKFITGLALLASLPAQALPLGPTSLSNSLPGTGMNGLSGPEIRVFHPVVPVACFYRRTEFRDTFKCYGLGNHPSMPSDMPDRVRSISMWPNTKLVLCTRRNFQGRCDTYIGNMPQFSGSKWDRYKSMKVMWKV